LKINQFKLISLLLIICLIIPVLAGCGENGNNYSKLKSKLAMIKTDDGRVGTCIVLEGRKILAPYHLINIYPDSKDEMGMSINIIFSDGSTSQAVLTNENTYSNVALLEVVSDTEDQGSSQSEQDGLAISDFKELEIDDELFIVGYDEAGQMNEIPVSYSMTIEKEGVKVVAFEADQLNYEQYAGAPVIDRNGNIYGVVMAVSNDDNAAVSISGDSIKETVTNLSSDADNSTQDDKQSRDNVIRDVMAEDYNVSPETLNYIFERNDWISGETTVEGIRFHVDQKKDTLVRLMFNSEGYDEYVIGDAGYSVATLYTDGGNYEYKIPRTFIRPGDSGELLLLFEGYDNRNVRSLKINNTGWDQSDSIDIVFSEADESEIEIESEKIPDGGEELIKLLESDEQLMRTLNNSSIASYINGRETAIFHFYDVETAENLIHSIFVGFIAEGLFFDFSLYGMEFELSAVGSSEVFSLPISDFEWLAENILNIEKENIDLIEQDIKDGKMSFRSGTAYFGVDVNDQFINGAHPEGSYDNVEKVDVENIDINSDSFYDDDGVYHLYVTYTFDNQRNANIEYILQKKIIDNNYYWTFLEFELY